MFVGYASTKTSSDEQTSDNRVPRAGISCKSLVSGEQVYLVRVWYPGSRNMNILLIHEHVIYEANLLLEA